MNQQESRTQAPHPPRATKFAEDRRRYEICIITKKQLINQTLSTNLHRMGEVQHISFFSICTEKWIGNAATITTKPHSKANPFHFCKQVLYAFIL
jgi:hypothetical protein